jgi:ubiquinol-cytochrome c reductase cytochrome c1 subunit
MKSLAFLFAVLIAGPACGSGSSHPLDKAPVDLGNTVSLQRGAAAFQSYCSGCHSLAYMRYSRLTDIGLTEDQIKKSLLPVNARIGDTMSVPMRPEDAKAWFGVHPPDLSVEARSRGADWIYTYLRTFYRDESRPTGWNNLVYEKSAMPHVLYQLQGELALEHAAGHDAHAAPQLVKLSDGRLSAAEYDALTGDITNYLAWVSEPTKGSRVRMGFFVIGFLLVLLVLVYNLKKEYWKDVH